MWKYGLEMVALRKSQVQRWDSEHISTRMLGKVEVWRSGGQPKKQIGLYWLQISDSLIILVGSLYMS